MSGRESIVVTLRLAGQKAFSAGAAAASKSLGGIGVAAETADRRTRGAGRGAVTAGQAFGGLAGLAGRGAIAVGGLGVAAIGMGVKFDAGMEQSRVAFTNLLGSGDAAKQMLDRLYVVAKETPFEFPELTAASQKLLGFGMQADKIVPTMTTIGDAVAGVGGGSEQISRITTALGQMQAKGKVSSEELMQMAESGVPAFKLLADQLGLTGAQLSKKLQAGAIGADKGIGAIVAGMNKKYGGMAKAQSKTFNGQLSSLKDSARQTLGVMAMPLFSALKKDVLPAVNQVAAAINKWAKGGGMSDLLARLGAVAKTVFPYLKMGFQFASDYARQLWDALKPLAPLFQNVLIPFVKGFAIGAIGGLVGILKIAIPVIRIIATVLGWLGQKARPLRGVFQGLGTVAGFVFGPSGFGKVLTMLPKVGKAFAWIGGKLSFLRRAFVAFKTTVANVAGAIGGAILSKLAGAFGRIASFLARIPGRWLDLGRRAAHALIRGLTGAFSAVGGLASQIGGELTRWLNDNTPFGDKINLPSPLPDFTLPALAGGGPVRFNGAALVGEQGPEIVTLRKGMHVVPNDGLAGAVAASGGVRHVTVRAPVYLDRRQVAEAVGSYHADQAARS